MSSFATTAISRPARARVAWLALMCAIAAVGGCRRELEGLKPGERPTLVPPPPGYRPVDPTPAPTPVGNAGGGGGGTDDGGGAGGGGGGATDAAAIAAVDGTSDRTPSPPADMRGSDLAPVGPSPPAPSPARPDAAVVRDTGQPDAVPGSGVVLYLPLDEGTGSGVAEDVSGNQNTATLRGLDVRGAWVDGRFGSALRFPAGAAASLRIEPAVVLNTVEMAMSISVWVRLPGPVGGDGTILSRRAQSAGGFIYALGVNGGRPRLRINSGNGYNLDLSGGQPIPAGDWVHLAVTFDKKTARLFIGGRPAASGVYELGIPQEETPLIVGAGQSTAGDTFVDRFVGDLDEIALFNRALSSAEIEGLAGGGRPDVR